MKTKIMLNKLAKRFPKRYAKMNHDFVGRMTGKMPDEVHKILLCLDLDNEILPEVIKYKPDMIISHHPFIFGTKYKVFKHDLMKKELCEKIDALNVPVYSFHTNFDTGEGGMNDALANALGLHNIYAPEKNIMMRIGELEKEMPIKEFAKYAKERLHIQYGQLVAKGSQMVKKVGIIGGGGSRSWPVAMNEECDIYISGDVPHYVRRDITLNKFNYLDFPHEIEKIFMPTMKNILLSYDKDLEIIIVDHEKEAEII